MRIVVVGCGAVGSFYGAKLVRAGHDVHFLLRSDYDAVRRDGLRILSPQGDFQVRPRVARRPEEIGPSELVLIGLKTTANAEFSRLLPPLVSPSTAIVTLQNGLGNEDQLAKLFPGEQILGGLCFVCLNRLEAGVIRHLDHGQVVLGEYQRPPQARTEMLAKLFARAGIECTLTENLARAHWEKLTWNIPFNGLGVAGAAGFENVTAAPDAALELSRPLGACLTTEALLGEERWARLVRDLMIEVATAARAQNLAVPDELADKQIQRTRSMGPYKASTLLDFELHRPLELESLFLEPLRQARRASVPMPRLEALCRLLQYLEAGQPERPGADPVCR